MTTAENDNLEENSAGAVSVSLNPGQTIGGIGDPVLPSAETVGSGDMLSVADIDDDEEEAKKDKTQKNLEMESFHLTFASFVNESVVNEGKFDNIDVKDLHFETDEKRAEEMKIELGKRQGEVTKTKQIEGGDYSLRRFRKEIKFGDGTYLGVFLPGSYDAATSTLGDGPHKKAVKKIKWNQKKYDQWLEDMAANGGADNAFDMAQNAKNEPGLIDWVKKEFRGDDALQRIQWDIEGYAESVVNEALAPGSKIEKNLNKALKSNINMFGDNDETVKVLDTPVRIERSQYDKEMNGRSKNFGASIMYMYGSRTNEHNTAAVIGVISRTKGTAKVFLYSEETYSQFAKGASFKEYEGANVLEEFQNKTRDIVSHLSKFPADGSANESIVTEKVEKIACLECDEVNTKKAWNKNNGFCPSCKDSSKGVAESIVTEASEDRMIKQIERALKDGTSIFKLPMATQNYYNKNKGDFEVVTEAKNTIGLAFKEEQDYLDFKEFVAEQPRGAIRKNIGFDSKTKSWNVEMDVKVLDSIYGEGTPSNKESGWYGGLPDDFESVIIESNVDEANKGKVHRAAKKGSYPAVIVVVQDGKVIHQEPVSTPEVAPATFNVMQEKYPKALLHLEDNTGKRLFSESVVNEASKDRMVKQIERALKDGMSIFKLPMATQKYYNKNKSDFESVVTESKGGQIMPGDYVKTQYGDIYLRVDGKVGGYDAYVRVTKGKAGKRKTSLHDSMKLTLVNKDGLEESAVTEGKYTNKFLDVKDLHFEIDPKNAEEMKIELGKRQGELNKRKQIEGGEYSLRRFRKEIKYDTTGKDLGVFRPGSYMAATSTLGDGPHKKAVKAVKWNQKKYDQWLEDMAANGGADNAFDMAQNARNEPGLIDWVKKEFRGEAPYVRIKWDIEAFAESVVAESKPFIITDFDAFILESKIYNK